MKAKTNNLKTLAEFKDEFYEAMKRMDEAYHKPLKYLK